MVINRPLYASQFVFIDISGEVSVKVVYYVQQGIISHT